MFINYMKQFFVNLKFIFYMIYYIQNYCNVDTFNQFCTFLNDEMFSDEIIKFEYKSLKMYGTIMKCLK
jgi:hypothetical protein